MGGQSSNLRGNRNQDCSLCAVFWTTADLEARLIDFQHYYNGHRTYAGLEGRVPEPPAGAAVSPMVSVRTGGGSIVEACTNSDSRFDPVNSPYTGQTRRISEGLGGAGSPRGGAPISRKSPRRIFVNSM